MAKQTINIGSAPNDGTGDTIRDAYSKINSNTDELYLDTHTHANKTILDGNTASYTISEQSKLAGIQGGAQINTVDSVNTKTGAVVINPDDLSDSVSTNKFTTAGDIAKLAGIESNATRDQTDVEIATAYGNVVVQVSAQEKTDGTETALRTYSPKDIADMANSGGGGTDPDAVHLSVDAELITLAEKIIPASTDTLIIEDSTASNVKKKVLIGNLPTGGGGEANTASNQGSAGIGVFDLKAGIDLQFRNIAVGSTQMSSTLNGKDILIDLVPGNINIASLQNAGALAVLNSVGTPEIDANSVTNAELDIIASDVIKGRISVGTGNVEDLTAADVRTIINVADGADVTATAGATMNSDTALTGNAYFLDEPDLVSNSATQVASQQSIKSYIDALRPVESMIIAASDETTDISVGSALTTFRCPYAFNLTDIRISLTTAPVGSSFVVDVKASGVSILSTLITIDEGEYTSVTAAIPPVISTSTLANDVSITVDVTQVGSTTAGAGLKVSFIGNRI